MQKPDVTPGEFDNTVVLVVVWAMAILLAGLALLREVGAPVTDSLWAEDGPVFLTGAMEADWIFDPLLEPYRGYFHVVPRLLATIVVVFPVAIWPWVVSVLTAILVSGLAVFVFYASEPMIESPIFRGLLAAWMLINPAVPEVSANLANLHWFLLIGAFWAFFAPDRPWMNGAGLVVVAAAALSNPITGVIALIGLARAWLTGSRRLLTLSLVGVAGASMHLLADNVGDGLSISARVVVSGVDLWTRSVFAALGGADLVFLTNQIPAVVLIVVALSVVVVTARRVATDRPQRWFVISVLLLSGLLTVGLGIFRGIEIVESAGRFLLVPAALILGMVLAGIKSRHAVWKVAVPLVVVGVLAINLVADTRNSVPRWSTAISNAAQSCEPGNSTRIPIHPWGWSMQIPCQMILSPVVPMSTISAHHNQDHKVKTSTR